MPSPKFIYKITIDATDINIKILKQQSQESVAVFKYQLDKINMNSNLTSRKYFDSYTIDTNFKTIFSRSQKLIIFLNHLVNELKENICFRIAWSFQKY